VQLSVVPYSHDSVIISMAESVGDYEPHWIVFGTSGTHKVGTNDSIWEYRDVSEFDSTNSVSVMHGIGEIGYDDGATTHDVDLANREDTTKINSTHTGSYILSSNDFVLPATGSLSYFCWVADAMGRDGALDRRRVWNLFVQDGPLLKVYLNAGDGVLVRLSE
jgi:hypothetical protein